MKNGQQKKSLRILQNSGSVIAERIYAGGRQIIALAWR